MKKALAIGLGAAALGRMGSASGIAGDKMATAKKLMTSDAAVKGSAKKFAIADGPLKGAAATAVKAATKTGPGIKVTQAMKDANLEKFKAANEAQRIRKFGDKAATLKKAKEGPSLFGFRFEKPLFKSGGSVMASCKLGRNKKTKIY